MALLKAGAEFDKKDNDGYLALSLAPDKEVCQFAALLVRTKSGIAYKSCRSVGTLSGPLRGRA